MLALLGAIASGFAFIDSKYVSQELFDAHSEQQEQQLLSMTAQQCHS
jgi:hypothetical protein